MNRVVLIGNGFDLAHGLPTRYEDFINWYWRQWYEKLKTSGLCVEKDGLCEFSTSSRLYCMSELLRGSYGYKPTENFVDWIKGSNVLSMHYSALLERIVTEIATKNWVDIEHEYYELLKESIEKRYPMPKDVNGQLGLVQKSLTEYLLSLTKKSIVPIGGIMEHIYEPIQAEDISVQDAQMFEEYNKRISSLDIQDWAYLIHRYNVGSVKCRLADRVTLPDNILLLNFNYTSVSDLYENPQVTQSIHIHGSLDDPERMIFGYGDDLDEDYKAILKSQDNELLRNIKSVRYLETDNYRRVLRFIDSDAYQIYIMGHSCGNSDRTLLNTLFEHKNCVSIKPFYYEKDGRDNYLDIVQNIMRSFTDMQLMRDRVVNKTQCKPLPQVKQLNYLRNRIYSLFL